MTKEQIYNAAKAWAEKHLWDIPNQEIDDIAMVWEAAIEWYEDSTIEEL